MLETQCITIHALGRPYSASCRAPDPDTAKLEGAHTQHVTVHLLAQNVHAMRGLAAHKHAHVRATHLAWFHLLGHVREPHCMRQHQEQ